MKKPSGSGSLQHLLVFEKLVETKDESDGSVTETWVPAGFTMYAEIVTAKTDEFFEFQRTFQNWPQYISSTIITWRMPYKSGIDSLKNRIRFEGEPYRIFPPVVNNRRTEMTIRATLYNVN